MSEQTYTVQGMTCENCRRAVAEEVVEVAGVDAVDVDLASGRVTVTGQAAEAEIRTAVHDAGYEVIG